MNTIASTLAASLAAIALVGCGYSRPVNLPSQTDNAVQTPIRETTNLSNLPSTIANGTTPQGQSPLQQWASPSAAAASTAVLSLTCGITVHRCTDAPQVAGMRYREAFSVAPQNIAGFVKQCRELANNVAQTACNEGSMVDVQASRTAPDAVLHRERITPMYACTATYESCPRDTSLNGKFIPLSVQERFRAGRNSIAQCDAIVQRIADSCARSGAAPARIIRQYYKQTPKAFQSAQ